MTRWKNLMILFAVLLTMTACSLGPRIEAHPDAPRLTLKTFLFWEKSGVYDKEYNVMRETGWYWVGKKYDGWTRHKFNWQEEVIAPEAAKRGHDKTDSP